jgi:DMSO/TMAO reductase YedYZ molybdopterin-dependent catalytic subunit
VDKRKNKLIYTTLILITAMILSACGSNGAAESNTAASALPSVEIQEYNGHKLSPVSDVKDVSISGPQKVDISKYKLTIDGLVETPREYTYDEVIKHTNYTKEVVLNCVEGWSADILWQGVLLGDLFSEAKVKSEADTVIFYASDGYTTSIPLQTIIDRQMIIAYKMNGVVLPEEDGYPFILVAEDKLGYKWIMWITRMEISSDSSYQGYWESRGYSNEADVTD